MFRCKAPFLSCILTILLCAAAVVSLLLERQNMQPDSIALSRLCDDIAAADGAFDGVSCDYPFAVFAPDGSLRGGSMTRPLTLEEAVVSGYQIKNLYGNGSLLATVVVERNAQLAYAAYTGRVTRAVAFVAVVLLGNVAFVMWYFNRTILRPFRNMERFAESVAGGNLDVPVLMDKKNVFGRFSESFDIMRLALKTARENEAAAVKAKQELASQLSHDIKTPLTSIKTSAELLAAKSDDPTVQKKTGIILHKTNQIAGLITDLFTDTLSELGSLQMQMTECTSAELLSLIHAADDLERITALALPDCVLYCDKIRLEQVFGNIISNSYKYADTAITVSAGFSAGFLAISFLDDGDGVDAAHLPHLCEQYYRVGGARTKPGAGLGLYIANTLMEKMGGRLELHCPSGFEAVVLLPLA